MSRLLVFPNLIYKSNTTSIKIPENYFVNTDTVILKLIWRGKSAEAATIILKKNNKVRELTLPNLKIYKAAIIKTLW